MIDSWQILRVGACRHPEAMTLKGGHWCPVSFPALVGLIRHRTFGPILFDTGYDDRFFAATEPLPERLYRLATPVQFDSADSLPVQLARLGLTPDDIAGVFVSHFHGDHVAGLSNFPKARIVCAGEGLKRIRAGSRFGRVRKGLLSALLPGDIDGRAAFFEAMPRVRLNNDMGPFTHGADVLGDGSLIAVELPGHCPGHWGLLIRPEGGKPVFFIGDAAWSIAAVADNRPPPAITTALLGETATYRRTLSALNTVSQTGAVELIPSHCEVTAAKWL
ncbi:MBL fold metallo-hydrolase [Asticcacaulis solisilvae]|uniref:MBL fold metallo-hydrolase n=1 Tax=Asticcacaulis solisilvae TaxID=1217274 RepID=UPI003FD6EBF1